MKRYRWTILSPNEQAVTELSETINVSLPIARALVNRGITTFEAAKEFFRPSLANLPSPFLFASMERAVERIVRAVEEREPIMLYGDYDVDGITGTALLYLFLKELGAELSWYINDRFLEGYGLSPEGVEAAFARHVRLIITIDCGIRDNEAIARCAKAGIDVIVCDHHEAVVLPPAYAIINPKVEDCAYPFRELSGCAVAFKVAQALAERLELEPERW